MYYNIKIKTNDSELSLDSNDKEITLREMDSYFAVIFGASDDFRANIKQVEIKKDNLRSCADFINDNTSSDLNITKETAIKVDDEYKAFEIKNTTLASNEIISIKNLKETPDIFGKINRKELYSPSFKVEKNDSDKDIELLNSKIAFLNSQNKALEEKYSALKANYENMPTVTLVQEPPQKIQIEQAVEKSEEPEIEIKIEDKSKLIYSETEEEPSIETNIIGPIEAEERTETPDEILINKPVEESLNEIIGELTEETKDEAKPSSIMDTYDIAEDESLVLGDVTELTPIATEPADKQLIETPKSSIAPTPQMPSVQADLIDDEEFELGSFVSSNKDIKEDKLPEIETIIAETKDAVQKDEVLTTLFQATTVPTEIEEIPLEELASKFNNSENLSLGETIYSQEIIAPTPSATSQMPIATPALNDTMVAGQAPFPVMTNQIEQLPTIEEISLALEPVSNDISTKPTIAEIQARLTIDDDRDILDIKSAENNPEPKEEKEYDILDIAKKKQEEKAKLQQNVFNSLIDFKDYLENFDCKNIYDEFLGCAYYLKKYNNQETFSIKTINAKLYQAKGQIADMTTVTTLIDNEYIEVHPQESSNLYSISKSGERYFKSKLKL